MKARTEPNLILRFMIACSLLGLLIILLMIIYPPATTQNSLWRKPFVGSVFFLICAGGSFVAVSPRTCSAAHKTQIAETSKDSNVKTVFPVSSEGHHPDCGRFSAHTIRFNGASYCAACTGLLIGGITAMSVTVLYFFLGLNAEAIGFPAVLIGLFGPVLGLVQFKFRSWTRLVANMLFVLGSSLMLIGIDQLVRSVFVDLYLTGLVLMWILTRVMISQWDHHRICLKCGFSCRTERKVGVLASSTQPVQSADDK
jgi:hypothetical protein